MAAVGTMGAETSTEEAAAAGMLVARSGAGAGLEASAEVVEHASPDVLVAA
jgi:hypothetical protein